VVFKKSTDLAPCHGSYKFSDGVLAIKSDDDDDDYLHK